MIGPILSDKELFSALDLHDPALEKAYACFENGEVDSARRLLAKRIRERLDPEAYFSADLKDEKPSDGNLLQSAEDALAHNMCSVGTYMKFDGPVDWFANPTYNQYKEWTWQLSRHTELLTLARAYRMTCEEKYAEGAVELLISWIRQAVRPDADTNSHATLCWRTIECGIRMFRWPEIIHSLLPSPTLTDDALIDIYKSIYEHAERLRNHPTKGNWQIMQLDGLVHLSIISPIFADAEKWILRAIEALQEELASQIFPEGFQFELTTGYHYVVIYNVMNVIKILDAYGKPVPASLLKTVEDMMEIYVKLLQSGRQIPNINDGKHEHIKHFLKLLGGRLSDNPRFRYFLTDGAEGSTPEYTSLELPYVGDFVFREGWEENAVTALFDAGKFGRSHQHEDKLNLLVYANGRPLLTEAQTYAYDSSDMRKYCLSSFGHNTAVVDELSQNRRLNFQWKDEYLSQREPIVSKITERLELAVGTYDEGYGEDAKPIAKHTRTVAFLKKPKLGRPLFAVVDTLESRDGAPHAYDIFWHAEQASLALSGSTAEGEDLRILTDGDGVSLSVVAGQTEPYVQGFVMRSTIQGDYYALPTLTAHAEGTCVRVLTLISVKENGISPVRAARLSGECVTLEYEGGESDEISLSVN